MKQNEKGLEIKLSWWIIVLISLFVAIALFFSFRFIFIINGNLTTGVGLTKREWLNFTGLYLAFIGTSFLGVVSLIQNNRSKKVNERLLKIEESKLTAFTNISFTEAKFLDLPFEETALFNSGSNYFNASYSKTPLLIKLHGILKNDVPFENFSISDICINKKSYDKKVQVELPGKFSTKGLTFFYIILDINPDLARLDLSFNTITKSCYSYFSKQTIDIHLDNLIDKTYTTYKILSETQT